MRNYCLSIPKQFSPNKGLKNKQFQTGLFETVRIEGTIPFFLLTYNNLLAFSSAKPIFFAMSSKPVKAA
jgi:hypothetical protein